MRETDFATFRTKAEAERWLKTVERDANPDHRDRRIIPVDELPTDRQPRAKARGHRWAMTWTYTVERFRMRGL